VTVLAAGGGSGGSHVVLAFAVVYAFFGFVFWAFKQRVGGAGGGAEKAIVGALWLLGAVVVGVLMGARPHHHSPAHLTGSSYQVTTH
jgi:hypothetical protein